MGVTLKFIGALRRDSGKDQITLECKNEVLLIDLVNNLTRDLPLLRSSLLDERLKPPKSNALVLVNGKEISILNGLQTKVRDGDEVVFIPVVHGG
ncbi:MAG: MoaD/ThiS family protein [Candidatus Bathyarchaeota archaeon]|nr:MoaD/ThiS family protein [Candidatus Bathyarchaeota archaeon]